VENSLNKVNFNCSHNKTTIITKTITRKKEIAIKKKIRRIVDGKLLRKKCDYLNW